MTWKYLRQRAAVALSGGVLARWVVVLALLIASRTMAYRSGLETETDEPPEVTIPVVVWVTELPRGTAGPVVTENP